MGAFPVDTVSVCANIQIKLQVFIMECEKNRKIRFHRMHLIRILLLLHGDLWTIHQDGVKCRRKNGGKYVKNGRFDRGAGGISAFGSQKNHFGPPFRQERPLL